MPQPTPTESVLIDGTPYQIPTPVACELLRLHIDALQLTGILDRRPAMNAGLPAAYAQWTGEVYGLMGAMAAPQPAPEQRFTLDEVHQALLDAGSFVDSEREEILAILGRSPQPAPAAQANVLPPVDCTALAMLDAQHIDSRYAPRLALALECMVLNPTRWSESSMELLDKYRAEWDRVNPMPPTFMGEPA